MWRDIIIVFFIILLVLFLNFIVQEYLKDSSFNLSNKLEEIYLLLKENMDSNDNTNNIDMVNYVKINELFVDFEKEWNEVKKRWELVEPHSEIDLIQVSFVNSKTSIENKEKSDICLYIKELQLLITHISERDTFKLKNIF